MWRWILFLVLGYVNSQGTLEELNRTALDCKSGFFEGPDCCSYYQCTRNNRVLLRKCGHPLVWNKEDRACDWMDSSPECKGATCHGPPPTPDLDLLCPQPSELPAGTCCISGLIYTQLSPNAFALEGDEKNQTCPNTQLFNVDDCCCEGGATGVQECLDWTFDDGTLNDVNRNVPAFAKGDIITEGADRFLRLSGSGLSIPMFTNGIMGAKFTLGMRWRAPVGSAGSYSLFSNGGTVDINIADSHITGSIKHENGNVDNIDETVGSPTGRRRKRQFTLGGGWTDYILGSGSLIVVINDDVVVNTTGPGGLVKGTECPLTIGEGLVGDIDRFFYCPFLITLGDLGFLQDSGELPTRGGR